MPPDNGSELKNSCILGAFCNHCKFTTFCKRKGYALYSEVPLYMYICRSMWRIRTKMLLATQAPSLSPTVYSYSLSQRHCLKMRHGEYENLMYRGISKNGHTGTDHFVHYREVVLFQMYFHCLLRAWDLASRSPYAVASECSEDATYRA